MLQLQGRALSRRWAHVSTISPDGRPPLHMLQGPFPLWRPDSETVQATNLAHFMSDFQVASLTLSSAVARCCSTVCGCHEQCGFHGHVQAFLWHI